MSADTKTFMMGFAVGAAIAYFWNTMQAGGEQ